MKRAMLVVAAALALTGFLPDQADAQVRRFGAWGGVGRGPFVAGRGPFVAGRGPFVAGRGPFIAGRGPFYAYPRGFYGYPRGYYGYRRGYYGPGVGAAVGVGVLAGAAVGAAAAAPYYADPCVRPVQAIDAWGYPRWTYVRVC
jgi:hypothetical protein